MTLRLIKKNDESTLAHTPTAELSAHQSLSSLNTAQVEAVRTISGPVLIVAGAGSGKTRVLTTRVAHLINSGIKPWNILALTFTNKAAGEMRERIDVICGERAAKQVWAGTFHSIFARLLREDAEAIGYTRSFSIYDADDTLSAIKSAMNLLGISQQLLAPALVRSVISGAKNKMMSWQEFSNSGGDFKERQIAKVFETYEKQLRKNNAMDFDDLLLNMIRILQSQPDVLHKYQRRFTHIMVDEYQDTNRAQYTAINLLASAMRNLCVVGDDAQSIYRWRGADIRNILDFQKDYPEAKVVRLEQNYRSTKNILAAADAVIKNNRKQIPKTLWTENDKGANIEVHGCRDDREEAEFVARIIRSDNQTHGTKYGDLTILYRTNAQSQALEDALRRNGIPYTMVSGISFYKRKEIKDVAAYLRLLLNPNDDESLLRIVNEPSRGIGDTSLDRLRTHATNNDLHLFEAFSQAAQISTLLKRAQTAATELASVVIRHREKLGSIAPDELAREYIEATGLLRMYEHQHTDEAEDRKNNIERLLNDITEYTLREEEPTLEAYLQQLALVSDVDEAQLTHNRVAVMTLHAAKGLEFPAVIIAGAEEGLLPLVKDGMSGDEREEERRLFYVGITRAEQRLYITYAERRLRFGSVEYSRPSSFLAELPPEVIDWKGKPLRSLDRSSTEVHRVDSAPAQKKFVLPEAPRIASQIRPAGKQENGNAEQENYSQIEPEYATHLKRGMKVRHMLFGVGSVESVVGVEANQKVVVNFPGAGRKNLMVKFAKLIVV